ncbi:Multiple RNA-binding domain-containing protein 1 [Orbilia ellipsospora]|uniref:Multiple RNA-binding domain-containing protein 1 n=1 Tax=Orbilia ellipsospora TaxID=2528407 RepID=A0AAV9XCV0_9PEZI
MILLCLRKNRDNDDRGQLLQTTWHVRKPFTLRSSRIFIRNLPTPFTDVALKSHFSKLSGSSITDCRFFPDRRIAFIGYKTPEQAEAAVKYFDRSYIKTSKLSVEIAKSAKDGSISRPWSANAPGSSAYAKKHNLTESAATKAKNLKRKRDEVEQPKKPADEKPSLDENDPKYREYMQLMKNRSNMKIWENETSIVTEELPAAIQVPEDESESEYEELSNQKTEKKKWKKDSPEPTSLIENDESAAELISKEADPEVLPDVDNPIQTGLSDADWLKAMTNDKLEAKGDADKKDSEKEGSSDEWGGIDADENMEDAPETELISEEPAPKSEYDLAVERIEETGRLFIRNLTYSVIESELEELFSQFGDLEEVHLPVDIKKHTPKGFAYIQFASPSSAITAFQTLDQSIFQGRTLHILPAEAKRESQLDDFALSKLPLKKQREILKKRNANKSDFEWNSLYMNINSVMASMADRLGVSKADMLDPTSTDAAVKQSHAETRVIQETKSYFENHGINLAAFAKKKRGDRVVLIKNFAYGTSIDELRALCNEFGETKRVLMPPTGTIAIVEFLDDPSGRAAFTRLYGRKFKESILKVEKAPEDIFVAAVDPTKKSSDATAVRGGNVAKPSIKDLISTGDEDVIPGETSSLFVKNLSFATTQDKLKDIFSSLEGFLAARIKTKPDPKNPGKTLSMGYGFVEFRNRTAADAAATAMNGYFLDGHKLEIRGSHRGEDAAAERKKLDARNNSASTKIIIKNLAFEVSEKQIRSLFGQYGKLRSVRVPKKFNKTSRGFGFAQFVSTREAENAMEALKHTHLHGRPLVLEWAKEEAKDAEEEIQRLQKKVGKQVDSVMFAKLSGAAGRKKFDIEETAAERAGNVDGDDDGDD